MRLLIGLTKVWKHLFKKEKAPKATNEMKSVEMDKYIMRVDDGDFLDVQLRVFVHNEYWKITKKWHKSAKKYIVHTGINGPFLMGIPINNYDYTKDKSYVGNLDTLYKQYYESKM